MGADCGATIDVRSRVPCEVRSFIIVGNVRGGGVPRGGTSPDWAVTGRRFRRALKTYY